MTIPFLLNSVGTASRTAVSIECDAQPAGWRRGKAEAAPLHARPSPRADRAAIAATVPAHNFFLKQWFIQYPGGAGW